jgi:hypothetical protein
LWTTDRDGKKPLALQGAREVDIYAMFFDQELYDRFKMNKEEKRKEGLCAAGSYCEKRKRLETPARKSRQPQSTAYYQLGKYCRLLSFSRWRKIILPRPRRKRI